MSIELVTLFVLAFVSVFGVAFGVWYMRGLPIKYAKRVIVNMDTGNAVEGVLVKRRGNSFTLRQPVVHVPGLEPDEAGGTVVIDRRRVEFIQILPSEATA